MIPERLTPFSVATPEAFVVPDPADVPLSVKVIVLPLTPLPLDVRVATRLTVPPYVPLAEATVSVVDATAVYVAV